VPRVRPAPTEARQGVTDPRRSAGATVGLPGAVSSRAQRATTIMMPPKGLRPTLDIGRHINARSQARLAVGARHERTLPAVACMPLILMEAPSSADLRGMLGLGKQSQEEEETSGASLLNNTNFTVASICMPGPCTSVL
jgi:hypothetical protein